MITSSDAQMHPSYPDLAGKRVLITGAGAGLGLSMATAFARQGSRLILNELNEASIKTAAPALAETGAEIVWCAGSVTDDRVIEEMFERADSGFGGVDVLVNNAGVSGIAPTLSLSMEKWRQCLDINLTAPLRCAQIAAGGMIERGGGVILNMSSIYGLTAAPERAAYCATKSALAMVTKVMAIEWAKHNVRVNALAPTYVRTQFVEDLIAEGKLNVTELERRTPNGRLATPEEIANLALFLASGAASAITGQVIAADGGWTSYGYV